MWRRAQLSLLQTLHPLLEKPAGVAPFRSRTVGFTHGYSL